MRHNTKFLFFFLVLGVFFSLSDAGLYARGTSEKPGEPTEVDWAKESTVRLVGISSGGTGFFIAPDKITTNFHVVAHATIGPIFAKLGHKETIWAIEGVMAFDAKSDIAILKVQGEGVPLPLADIQTLQTGETVFLAGYPNLGEYKVTEGVVKDIRNSDKWIKTTVEAYPGNSGSPVLNSKGEVIGIHVGDDYDIIPSSALKSLLAASTSTEPLEQWRERKVVRTFVYYEQGKQKYNAEDSEGAINDYNQAIELNPDNAEIYKSRARAKAKLGDHRAAIADYDQAIILNPDDAYGYYNRGQVKKSLGDYVDAIEDFTHAIELMRKNKRTYFIYNDRADAKLELKDYRGAIEDWTHAINLEPENPHTYYLYNERGKTKRKLEDHEGAMDDFTHAIKLKPNDAYAYINRGFAKKALDDHEGAIEDFTHAVRCKVDDVYGYKKRGMAKAALRDHKGAIEDFTHVIKLQPDNPAPYRLRAYSHLMIGKVEAAQIDLEKAKELESAQ